MSIICFFLFLQECVVQFVYGSVPRAQGSPGGDFEEAAQVDPPLPGRPGQGGQVSQRAPPTRQDDPLQQQRLELEGQGD